MQTKKSVRLNRYKFKAGDYAWIVPTEPETDPSKKILIKVKKRLLRPFRDSVNFYLCEHQIGTRKFDKIHYETEMMPLDNVEPEEIPLI